MMINEATINELNGQLKGLSFYNEWYSECCNGNLFGLAATVGTTAQDLPRSLSNFLKARGQEVSDTDIDIIRSISEVEIISINDGDRFDRKLHTDFKDNRNYNYCYLSGVKLISFGFKTELGDIAKKAYFIA